MKQAALLQNYVQVHPIKPATVKLTRRVFRYLNAVFGDIDIEGFGIQHVEDFQGWILKSGRNKVTANIFIKTIRPVFQWALRRELIKTDPFKHTKLYNVPDPEVHTYEPEDVGLILNRCNDLWKARVLLGVTGGLRRGEVLNLTIGDIDFENETVRVQPKKTTRHTWPWEAKNGKPRKLPLIKRLTSKMLSLLAELPSGQPYLMLTPECYQRRITQFREGKLSSECMNLPHRSFNKAFSLILRKANVKGTFHDLRRTCITKWANALPLHETKELAGHSSATTTLKYYVAINEQSLIKRAAAIGATGLEPATS